MAALRTGVTLAIDHQHMPPAQRVSELEHSLGRICRVDDDGVFALFIRDQVGVVVATAHP